MKRHSFPCVAVLVLVFSMSACTAIPPDQRIDADPWESMNRSILSANFAVDKVITRPLARGYKKITPGPIGKGISNFFQNLTTPRSIVNNFLQGKPGRGFSETARFLFNSTIGIGGLIDIATLGGMDEYVEDFGQTAAVWGIPDGPYVMLPALGPYTLRDALLLPVDIMATPLYHYGNTSVRDKLYVLRLIELRHRLLPVEKSVVESPDPYVTIRSSYLQNRDNAIYDGNPPFDPDDDFFDEFLNEE